MTKVVVDSGICGMTTTIEVVSLPPHKVRVAIVSDCEMVSKMGERLKELDWPSLWRQRRNGYDIYQVALQCELHITCPVPVAILKAIEAEAGLALPKDVAIRFKSIDK